MKNKPVTIAAIIVGIIVAVALLYKPSAPGPSQIDQQTQVISPSAPTAISNTPVPFPGTPTASVELVSSYLPWPTFEASLLAQATVPPLEPIQQGYNLHVDAYQLDEIKLAKPQPVTIDGTPTETAVAWRLTVVGGPFQVGSLYWVIWLDDKPLGTTEANGLDYLAVLVFNKSLLRDGGMIYISYGMYGRRVPVARLNLSAQK